jgi:branched-chain amino acid transport system permease protein
MVFNLSVRWISKKAARSYKSFLTVALFLIINGITLVLFGKDLRKVESPFGDSNFAIYHDVSLSSWSIGVIVVSGAMSGALWFFFNYSVFGIRLRAMAENRETAQLHGIDTDRWSSFAWGISAAIGAVAGVLLAPSLSLHPNMMYSVVLYSFTSAVIGGLNNPLGAVVGGVLVGLVENLTGTNSHLGAIYKVPAVFCFLIVILAICPRGLFGDKETRKI